MTNDTLHIDGSLGEGGGQVLRTSLGLSLVTGKGFHMTGIRAGRKRPGLLRQHLTCVEAAATLCGAEPRGAKLGSRDLCFQPRAAGARGGRFRFSIGTAGSTTLVLQALLPSLMRASDPIEMVLEGGTHNPHAPPFDFLVHSLCPVLEKMGARPTARLERPGFFPAGGGRLSVSFQPAEPDPPPLCLESRGKVLSVRATARVAGLPTHIAHRELKQARDVLGLDRSALHCEELDPARGPGNVVLVRVEAENVTEVFCGFGQKGLSAEQVGKGVARAAKAWLESGAAVGEHLADQLIPLMAVAGAGSFQTMPLSSHATTQLDVVAQFLDVPIRVEEVGQQVSRVVVG